MYIGRMSVTTLGVLLSWRKAPLLSQKIFTRASDAYPRAVQYLVLGTWRDKFKRWRSQGQDKNSEPKSTVKDGEEPSNSPLSKTESALKAKEEKVTELEDKYMRALAETENVRQRMSKQVQEAKKFGIHGFAKDLLDVADILEKASDSVSDEDLKSGSKTFIALVEGLKLTEAELQKVFKKNGVMKFDGTGDKFDPSIHEALFEVAGDIAGTVAVVSRRGYMLHERTLRPARVGVVKFK